MNLFFDEESQKLIVNAKKEMYELKHPYVGSEHLLLSILHSDLDICRILSNYGITYDKFKNKLISIVGIGTNSNTWFLFTPLLRRIINNATYYSKDSSKMVTPYSLFVAILEEGDGVANRILLSMNVDIDKLREEFLSNDYKTMNNSLVVDELGINMNKCVYDPVIGRDKEIDRVIQILLRKNKNNPLLIGEAGVGKTAIVEELSRRIVNGQVPYKLKNVTIYSISMSILVAGTKYRGEFEERINKLLTEIVDNPNIILFIDEIHTLMGAGGAEGAIDASNIVKPYLARGNIKVIGATTIEEYNKFISKDKALDRRFQKINIYEANRESVFNILLGLRNIYEKYHGVILKKDVLKRIVDLSYTAIFNGRQPDKAIDLLDEVCAYVTLNNSLSKELLDYETNIKKTEKEKNNEIRKHNFKKALFYKNKELDLRSKYNDKLFNGTNRIIISKDDVEKVVCNRYGIISKDEILERIKGYKIDENIGKLIKKYDFIKNVSCMSALLINKNVMEITFLVDKIAKNIFECNYIVIDMNEYKEWSNINKLFESIKNNPFSIIYIKNIDKCNRRIMKIIYDSIDKGSIGEINISKCIFFMSTSSISSNIGFEDKIICKEGLNNFNKIVNYN